MGSWEDEGDAWVGESEVLWQGGGVGGGDWGGDYKVRHQLKPLSQSADMENEEGGGCYFFLFFFCYHPSPEMANYRDTRRTNKQINT